MSSSTYLTSALRLPRLRFGEYQGSGLPKAELEEEERSLLGSVLGGLEFFGNLVDTPRSIAWSAAIGRNPLEVADPFSQEAVSKRLTGWDLTKSLGLPQAGPGAGLMERAIKGIPSLAAEIVLDPLGVVGGPLKALTQAGKQVAKAAKVGKNVATAGSEFSKAIKGTKEAGRILGLTPWAREQEIRQGLRGLVSLGLPFGIGPRVVLGAGSDKAADLYHALHYSRYSPVPYIRSLGSKIVGGVEPLWKAKRAGGLNFEALGHVQHDAAFSHIQNILAARNDAFYALEEMRDGLTKMWDDIGKYARSLAGVAGNSPVSEFANVDDFLRYIAENPVAQSKGAKDAASMSVPEIQGLFPNIPEALQPKVADFSTRAEEYMRNIGAMKDAIYDEIRRLGGSAPMLEEWGAKHVARHINPAALKFQDILAKTPLHKYGIDEAKARAAMLKLPGHTNMAQMLARDELLTGTRYLDEKRTTEQLVEAALAPPRTIQTRKQLRAALESYLGPEWVKANTKTIEGKVVDGKVTKTKVVPPSIADMQKEYLKRKYFLPELNALESSGRLAPGEIGKDGQYIAGSSGYEKWLEEFFPKSGEKGLADALVSYLASQPEIIRQQGLYNRNTLKDWMEYLQHAAVSYANLLAAHNLTLSVAKPITEFPGYRLPIGGVDYERLEKELGLIPLGDAWRKAIVKIPGKNPFRALTNEGLETFKQMYEAQLSKKNPQAWQQLVAEGTGKPDFLDRAILVDSRLPDVLTKYVQLMSPDTADVVTTLFDKLQSAFRYGVTVPWPAFIVRNAVDGMWRNFARVGENTYGLKDFWNAATHALKVNAKNFGRNTVETDLKYGKEMLVEDVGLSGATKYWATGQEESTTPFSVIDALLGKPKDASKPLQATGQAPTTFEKIKAPFKKVWGDPARRLYEYGEFLVRYIPYHAAREAGKSPSQAAALVREIQFAYGRQPGGELATSFGNRVMRRVYPFWSFVQNNVPYQFSQLFNAPAGGHAQTLRIFARSRQGSDEESYIPKWMREQTGIRTGGTDEAAHFIRSFGLSMEQALGMPVFQNRIPINRRTLQRAMAEWSPILQMPVRWLTGIDIYSGRPQTELAGPTGIEALDKTINKFPGLVPLLRATPVSRGLSTFATLVDERKTWPQILTNLLTGVKIGTYNLPQQKLFETEDLLKSVLAEDPYIRQYTQPYVPKKLKADAPAETLKRLALLEHLEKKRRAMMKAAGASP